MNTNIKYRHGAYKIEMEPGDMTKYKFLVILDKNDVTVIGTDTTQEFFKVITLSRSDIVQFFKDYDYEFKTLEYNNFVSYVGDTFAVAFIQDKACNSSLKGTRAYSSVAALVAAYKVIEQDSKNIKNLIKEVESQEDIDTTPEETADILYFKLNILPHATTSIAGTIEYGYGKLDENGFWEFPLSKKAREDFNANKGKRFTYSICGRTYGND